jgi:hypothetical protein
MQLRFLSAWVIGATLGAALAQQPNQERLAELKQSLAQNQQALRQYSWIETTQVSLKGDVKKITQKQCAYGTDGKVQKVDMAPVSESSGRKGGPLKRKIVANKKEETEEYMDRVAALVGQYVPPDSDKLQAAASAGNLTIQPASGVTTLTFKNYLKTGDTVSIGFDSAAKKMKSFNVQSFLDDPKDDAVVLKVNFASLLDGTAYPQQSTLDVKAKKMTVKVTNGSYKK